ncbi:MAG: hypothetical protein HYV08_12955 [Deltaproteobacteria bacterium]|nr:hypothetical protein [Deltaproteobacteria bacterium]MBI3078764.1 hypothetical protein [Deltaproteobacteria bacterium]
MLCHLPLFLPIAGLLFFWVLPWEIALVAYAAVLGVSALLYVKVRDAMRAPVSTGMEGMIGREAEALEDLRPLGHVMCGSERWRAEARAPVGQGQRAIVREARGLVLIVEPVAQREPRSSEDRR